jgi:tRNA pseudouridine38-40 synthase
MSSLLSYRMDLAYIGTNFTGFQSQINNNAIQDHIEKALSRILEHPLRIRGASRTDSGVHAQHQVAVFRTDKPYRHTWISGINAHLPNDIRVYRLEAIDPEFHPIRDAVAKAYRYRMWEGKCFDPFCQAFVWPVHKDIDWELFRAEAEDLVGRHDFAGFRNVGSRSSTTVRTIFAVGVYQYGPLVDFWIQGDGFLKQMVRIITGTLVAVGRGKLPRGSIREIIRNGTRTKAGKTAPAQGLSLVEIFYGDIPPISRLVARAEKGFTLGLTSPLDL